MRPRSDSENGRPSLRGAKDHLGSPREAMSVKWVIDPSKSWSKSDKVAWRGGVTFVKVEKPEKVEKDEEEERDEE